MIELPSKESKCPLPVPAHERGRWLKRHGRKVCYVCGSPYTSPHHIIPQADGGLPISDNIVWLCEKHHNDVEGPLEGAWDRIIALADEYEATRHSGTQYSVERSNGEGLPMRKQWGARSRRVVPKAGGIPYAPYYWDERNRN